MGAASGVISGAVGLLGAGAAQRRARDDRRRAEQETNRLKGELNTLENSRQPIINPYANVTDTSGNLANTYANLGVATEAAQFQAEQADISLANTLDTLRSTGASNPIIQAAGGFNIDGNVTASGNISSSGDIISATSKIGLRDLGNTEHTTIGTTAQGDIFYHHSGVTTIPGAIYNFASNGNIALTQTSSFANRTSTGSIFMAVGTNSANDGLLLRGVIKGHTAHANSYGQVLYLSSNGSSSASPPTATDSFARVIGHQLSGSGTIYFNPDNTFVKVS